MTSVDVCRRCLHVNTFEPTCSGELSQSFRVMNIALVDARSQYTVGMTRADALNRNVPLDFAVIQER